MWCRYHSYTSSILFRFFRFFSFRDMTPSPKKSSNKATKRKRKETSSSPQIQQLQEDIESVHEEIALIIENTRIIEEKIANAQQILNNTLPATQVNGTNDTVVGAAVGKDEPADLAVRVAPEETNTLPSTESTESTESTSLDTLLDTHDLFSSDIYSAFDVEMLEPNKEYFFGVPVDGMASNNINVSGFTCKF